LTLPSGAAHHDTIRAALKEVLANVELPEMHDGWKRDKIFEIFHFPDCKSMQQRAFGLLKKDEALQLQLALAERRRGIEQGTIRPIACNGRLDTKIMKTWFPYQFTHDQTVAVRTVVDDLSSSIPMQRLIHGEVGSGKTSVAFYAAMLAALNGKRTLILCPTSILAQQHYDTLQPGPAAL
jgi:ATP-dependent DNA helicase RecG